jgi:NAD(P)H-hydrate epimerase
MRAVDRRAIEELGIPSLVLMENAALGVVDALGECYPGAETVVVLCGPGNNGGDGLAAARHLSVRGYRVRAFVVHSGARLRGDAAAQLEICRRMEIPLEEVTRADQLPLLVRACWRSDLVVDALFGTGLTRPLGGLYGELIRQLEGLPHPVLAVDLPSGLDAGRAEAPGPHLAASLTVTFAAPKVAHVLEPAADSVGELVVTDLGVPRWLVEEAEGGFELLLAEELAAFLGPRPAASHKGDFGHALVVAGGTGMVGAAILAARAAVRSGAGLVTLGIPAPFASGAVLGSLESLTLPLSADRQGHLSRAAVEEVLAACEGKQVLALGPGLGQRGETPEAIREVAIGCPLPLVLDADGLNAFAGRAEELARRPAPTVLTPHPGELARLLAAPKDELMANRLETVRDVAKKTGSVLVLKGHQSLIATPDGGVALSPTGNPGMASGGSGDVLTGALAGLAAQGYELRLAAWLAVYLHGLAGDLACQEKGEVSLAAGDLVEALPEAFRRLLEA